MKHKKQNQEIVEESEQDEKMSQNDNETNETNVVQYTDEDKEKGNLKNFQISKKLIKKLKARNVEFLYPIQRKCYSSIYEQNNCVIQASNGSGKTLGFVIPIVELLENDKSVELVAGRSPRVLVISSTRDTIKSISNEFQSIVNDLSIATVYKSKKKTEDQETAIVNGCDILVATADRLEELIENKTINLSRIKHVILDEMDQIIDTDIVDHFKKILKNIFTLDENKQIQLIVFSQTMPDSVRKLTKKYLTNDFVTINLTEEEEEETTADDENMDESVKESTTTGNSSLSLLTKQENYTTYQLSTNDEIKSVGFVFTMLRKCFGDDFDAKGTVTQIGFTKDYTGAVFDLPSELDEQLQSRWKNTARISMVPITTLPELDESSMYDNKNSSSGGYKNSGRSNACFNCQKEGHKSWECPESNNSRSNKKGGNKSGGGCFNCGKEGHRSFECTEPKKADGRSGGGEKSNACFNCGKEGHRSFECTEPKKAGGRSGGGERSNACFNCGKEGHKSFECTEPKKAGGRSSGGEKSNACFNCGKEGHKSFECSEPKKAGGRSGGGEKSNACFNCGQEGHRSFDCPEPKKGRSSFGAGPRGGAGAKRSFGGHNENGHAQTEVVNKKIKFDDDDD